MESRGLKKIPGISWTVTSDNTLHEFCAHDNSHHASANLFEENWKEFQELKQQMNYEPLVDLILENISFAEKALWSQ